MNIIKPKRDARVCARKLVGKPETVFPLLCPVREAQWIEGWKHVAGHQQLGHHQNPIACWLRRATLTTPMSAFTAASGYVHWNAQDHAEGRRLQAHHPAPRNRPQLGRSASPYSHTSLGSRGDAFVASFTEEFYTRFMQDSKIMIALSNTERRCASPEEDHDFDHVSIGVSHGRNSWPYVTSRSKRPSGGSWPLFLLALATAALIISRRSYQRPWRRISAQRAPRTV